MKTTLSLVALATLLVSCAQTRYTTSDPTEPLAPAAREASAPAWTFDATIIEACSCPMFCQCYFNSEPASHPGCCPPGADPADAPRYCRFNNAFRVDGGEYDGASLAGAHFWIAGDLGGDFSDGEMDRAILHFEPSVTEKQREGILAALGAVYDVKWKEFEVAEDLPIEWKATRDRAEAKLDGGKAAEVVLKKNQGMTEDPIVIHNLKYWGAPRNDGFVLMQNEVEAYRLGAQPYEHRGSNGFMITIHASSKDAKSKPASGY